MSTRRVCCVLVVAVLAAVPLTGQSFLAWKGLRRGLYPVSFATATVGDLTRTIGAPTDYLGRPRPGYGQRPIHIAIWQPARSENGGTAMTFGDYLPLLAWAAGTGPDDSAARQAVELRYIQTVTPLAGPPDPTMMDRLLGEAVWARRDAPPATSKFPVLIYAPGFSYPAFDNSVLFEFLASHGYVVIASPSIGAGAGRMTGDVFGIEAQTRDLEFLAGYVQTLPQADAERIGTAGYSWGGLGSLLFALRNSRARAVISLDSVVRHSPSLAMARSFPRFSPEQLRVPTLVVTTTPDVAIPGFDDEAFLEEARFADITRLVVPGIPHHDMASFSSLLRRASKPGGARDWAPATEGYEAICTTILKFLDAHLKGGGADESEPLGVTAGGYTVSTRKAQKAPPGSADFLEVLATDGPACAGEMLRTAVTEDPAAAESLEPAINQAGYELLGGGRLADAIAVFVLGVELAPDSFNASDSLGEAYLAAGDLERARQCYLDAKSKLARATAVSPEVRARYLASANQGLAAVESRRQK